MFDSTEINEIKNIVHECLSGSGFNRPSASASASPSPSGKIPARRINTKLLPHELRWYVNILNEALWCIDTAWVAENASSWTGEDGSVISFTRGAHILSQYAPTLGRITDFLYEYADLIPGPQLWLEENKKVGRRKRNSTQKISIN